MKMTGNEYQKKARGFATGGGDTFAYAMLGLIEEVGELCGKVVTVDRQFEEARDVMEKVGALAGMVAKEIRKDWDKLPERRKLALGAWKTADGFDKELGDVAWMLVNVAHHCGLKMDDVLAANITKLTSRKNRNVIIGEGDNR